jgi:phosphate starvation-inducible PhoH-like protein
MEAYLSLFGMNDRNMTALEQELDVMISLRGQEIQIQGDKENALLAEQVIGKLIEMLRKGEIVAASRIRYAVALAREGRLDAIEEILGAVVAITHRGRRIQCKTLGQREYVSAVRENELTIAVGPAGTGKTYLAMAMAVVALKNKEVERIVLTRPAVEAGERLGFLPGDMTQKVDPYLRPLYDALYEIIGVESYQRLGERGTLEVAPLAFMRGRTLGDAFIILDEARTRPEQMKMFLTRLGAASRCIVTGDISQIDLPKGRKSGLVEAVEVLKGVEGVSIVELTARDVVRHELVQKIVRAYEAYETKGRGRSLRPGRTRGKREKRSVKEFFYFIRATGVICCWVCGDHEAFEAAIVPMRYNLAVGMVPTSTIAATKDVVDELSTQKKREEAAAQVTPTYRFQEGVTETVMSDFDQIFAQLRAVRQYAAMLPDYSSLRVFSKDELQYARNLITLISLSDYQLTSLMRSSQAELEEAYTLLYAALQSTMQGHVTEGQENTPVYNIRQIVNYRVPIPLGQNGVPAVLNGCIRANMIIDQEVTEAAREAAREAVEPVVYKQGQNIVVRGEGRITANQLAMLSTLGLLSNGGADMTIYIGAAVLVAVVMAGMLLLLHRFPQVQVMDDNGRLLLMLTTFAMSLSVCVLGRLANSYIAPTMMCALLVTALLGLTPGVVCNAALTILVAALAAGGSEEYAEKMALLLASGLLSGTAATMVMNRKGTRLWVLVSGLVGTAVDFIAIMALGLMTNNELSGSLLTAAWRAAGCAVGTLLCIAVQPLLEMIFNLPTPMKLMELSNPNQPLLRRLLLEAPGTYHHSPSCPTWPKRRPRPSGPTPFWPGSAPITTISASSSAPAILPKTR